MTEDSDLVSVIVPAYNAAATIGQTLQSCLAQTHRALEVVVVDDGSSDATADIVRSFATRDRRVRLLQQENAGVAAARNLAIAHAKGAYVAPLDADDLWHPEKIALQVEAMRRGGPRVGVVYCWSRWIDELGLVGPAASVPYPHEGYVYTALITRNILENASTPLIRRACLLEVGGFDTSLRDQGAQGCEDLRLYLQLAERCDFALVRRFLVGYRVTRNNMSSDPQQMLRSHRYVLAEARRRHPELPGWLFRLGEARYAFYLGKPCFKNGKPVLGLVLLIDAVLRDPAAVLYRLAEGPYRALAPYLRGRAGCPPSVAVEREHGSDELPPGHAAAGLLCRSGSGRPGLRSASVC
jgi:glycosyltransferase involved in cell wall biosynthesis